MQQRRVRVEQAGQHLQLLFVVLAAFAQGFFEFHLLGDIENRDQHMWYLTVLISARKIKFHILGQKATAGLRDIDFHQIERVEIANQLFLDLGIK